MKHINDFQNISHIKKHHFRQSDEKLKSIYGNYYTGEIQLGSNNEKFNALFDTGSAWIWFTSNALENTGTGITHHFDCKGSTTCKDTDTVVPL